MHTIGLIPFVSVQEFKKIFLSAHKMHIKITLFGKLYSCIMVWVRWVLDVIAYTSSWYGLPLDWDALSHSVCILSESVCIYLHIFIYVCSWHVSIVCS